MATMYVRNGRYYINYNVNGKRVRKSLGTNKTNALIYLREIDYRLFKGHIKPDKPRVPVDYVIKRYLVNCKSRLAPSTHKRYQSAIKHFIDFLTYHSPAQYIDQINKIMLSEYVDFRTGNGKKTKGNTVNQELTIIRAMLGFAVDSEYIDKNPASRVKMLKTNDAKKGMVIQPEEIDVLLQGCMQLRDGPWFKEILLTFLNTGMRLGELLNLTWNDIEDDVIKIQDKGFWSPKTYERDIPTNQLTKEIINRQRDKHDVFVFIQHGEKIKDNVCLIILISKNLSGTKLGITSISSFILKIFLVLSARYLETEVTPSLFSIENFTIFK